MVKVPTIALAKPLGSLGSEPTGAGREVKVCQFSWGSPSWIIFQRIANKGSMATAVKAKAKTVIPVLNPLRKGDRGSFNVGSIKDGSRVIIFT